MILLLESKRGYTLKLQIQYEITVPERNSEKS